MKLMRYLSKLMSILACLHLWSCDVHEFPYPLDEDDTTPFVLHLDYDTNIPLYKTVEYTEDARSVEKSKHDVRYIVKVYPGTATDGSGELHHFVFTKNDVSVLNHSVTLKLKEGNYKFLVWSDYVTEGSKVDHLYNTLTFDNIALKGKEYQGNTDVKDAFRGTVVSEVSANVTSARMQMERPLAKINFISTDWENFVIQYGDMDDTRTASGTVSSRAINLNDYKVVFRYQGSVPDAYNMYSDQSASSLVEKTFESTLKQLGDTEVDFGFDYLFAEAAETYVNVTVEISDKDGNLLSSFTSMAVPFVRGKLTVVELKFRSPESDNGAAIDPDYNGDYNIKL